MMKIQLSRLSWFCFLIGTSMGCRTAPNNAYLLDHHEGYLDPDAQNMGIELDPESAAAEQCFESGGTQEYRLRPVDAEESPIFHVSACIDGKFILRKLQIKITHGDVVSTLKPDTVQARFPPDYVTGIFDQISYVDSAGQKIEIVSDYEVDYAVPGSPGFFFYNVTIGNESPILMYQANVDDDCPREWFASEEANQKFETASGNFVMRAYNCQSSSADGTVINLPLWLRFEALPESLENDVQETYRFIEMTPHALRRNFRHELAIDDLVFFIDTAINDGFGDGKFEFYPSRIRDYKLESRSDPCDLTSEGAEDCLTESSELKWSYDLIRTCVGRAPQTSCHTGDMEGEFYCHNSEWRCRYRQTSASTHQKLEPVGKGQRCELGEEALFIPHCKKGLSCQHEDDSDQARCI